MVVFNSGVEGKEEKFMDSNRIRISVSGNFPLAAKILLRNVCVCVVCVFNYKVFLVVMIAFHPFSKYLLRTNILSRIMLEIEKSQGPKSQVQTTWTTYLRN